MCDFCFIQRYIVITDNVTDNVINEAKEYTEHIKKMFCDVCYNKFVYTICTVMIYKTNSLVYCTTCRKCGLVKRYSVFPTCYDCYLNNFFKKRLQQLVRTSRNLKRKQRVINKHLSNILLFIPTDIINIISTY